ncbi:ADP-ribosylation factor-like protein 13B [Nymphon striatum]|nr:ADP-ribosylation factor-like protein 13B [Nymphon striatum]
MPGRNRSNNKSLKSIQNSQNAAVESKLIHSSTNHPEPSTATTASSIILPKHFSIPEDYGDNESFWEFFVTIFGLLALGTQYLNLYRTLISEELPVPIKSVVGNVIKVLIFSIVFALLLWFGYNVMMKQTQVVTVLYLCYPLFVYFLVFGLKISQFLEVISWPKDKAGKLNGMIHNCTMSAELIREEVDMFKENVNLRIKQLIFNSLLSAYYASFIPCCFAQTVLHYDMTLAAQHAFFVLVSSCTMYFMYCFPTRYCDILHRSALHLGKWNKIESRSYHLPCTTWSGLSVWNVGSLVKHSKEFFKAEGNINAAEPGNSSHSRFYNLFIKPSVLLSLTLAVQVTLVLTIIITLINTSEWKITILMVGLDNAGKTCTVKNLLGESIEGVAPTVGFSKFSLNKYKFDITIYDLGGGQSIRGIWKNYFAEVCGIVFVMDSNAPDRMEECKETITSLLDNPIITGKPMLLLANKQDIDSAMDEIDLCNMLELENLVNSKRTPTHVETCSAYQVKKKHGKAIQTGFKWLIKTIDRNWNALSARVEHDVERQKAAEENLRQERIERVRKIREEREKEEGIQNALGEVNDDEKEIKIDNPFRPISEIKKEIVSQELEKTKALANNMAMKEMQLDDKKIKNATINGEIINPHQDRLIIDSSVHEIEKKDVEIQEASSSPVSSRIHSPISHVIQVTPKHMPLDNDTGERDSTFSEENKKLQLTSYVSADNINSSLVSIQTPEHGANIRTVVAQIERQDSDLVSEKNQCSLPSISSRGNLSRSSAVRPMSSEVVSSPMSSQEDLIDKQTKKKKKRNKFKKNKVTPAHTSTEESTSLEKSDDHSVVSSRFTKLPPLRVANASSSNAHINQLSSFSSVDITKYSDDSADGRGRMQWENAEDLQTIVSKEDLHPS